VIDLPYLSGFANELCVRAIPPGNPHGVLDGGMAQQR
jgi:hypothetical protein